MPRQPRVYIEGALYYITSEGNQNRDLFNDKADYDSYLELLAKYKKELGFKLFAFVLLPRHLHLLIEPKGTATISAIMHDLNSLYTKAFNSRYQRKGHLFQGRFKSIIVEKQPFLLNLTRYVHLNPKRSGLASEIKDYAFSSYQLYISNKDAQEAVRALQFPNITNEIQEVLGYFNDADKQKAYQDYVASLTEKENFEIARLLHRKAFIGSKEFEEKIDKAMEIASQEEDKMRVSSKPYQLFLIIGTLIIIVLGIVAFYLYASNLETKKRFNLFMYDFGQNLLFTTSEVKKNEAVLGASLDNSEWVIRLTSSSGGQPQDDLLSFKDRKVVSQNLSLSGFPSSNYSVTTKDDGSMVWETIQTKEDDSTATWYGVWSNDMMKGILSLRSKDGGESQDYSFVSIKKK